MFYFSVLSRWQSFHQPEAFPSAFMAQSDHFHSWQRKSNVNSSPTQFWWLLKHLHSTAMYTTNLSFASISQPPKSTLPHTHPNAARKTWTRQWQDGVEHRHSHHHLDWLSACLHMYIFYCRDIIIPPNSWTKWKSRSKLCKQQNIRWFYYKIGLHLFVSWWFDMRLCITQYQHLKETLPLSPRIVRFIAYFISYCSICKDNQKCDSRAL